MYIWENYTPYKKFCVGEKISPYVEVLNDISNIIEVNPLLRFEKIFAVLKEVKDCSIETQEFENIIFHYLAYLDMLKGMDKKQIFFNRLEEEIQAGYWGKFVQEKWKEIQPHHKEVILYTLYQQKDNSFFEAIKKLFAVASLVYEKSSKTYYLYLGASITEERQILLNVTKFLFWDIQNKLEIVWKNHYGMIGFDETMKLSEIQIV